MAGLLKINRVCMAVATGALAMLVSGCPKTVETIHLSPTGEAVEVRTDPVLSPGTRFVRSFKRMEGDMLRVEVELANDRSVEQDFQYQFTFFEEDGAVIHSPMAGWDRISIPPRGSVVLRQVAPDPRARSAKLELKRPIR